MGSTLTSLTGSQSSVSVNASQPGRFVQDFELLWLDANYDPSKSDFKGLLAKLYSFITHIEIFSDKNAFINFLNKLDDVPVFVIVSGSLGQSVIPEIHDRLCIDSIYIFCYHREIYEKWAKDWKKVRGVFTRTDEVHDMLKQDALVCERNSNRVTTTTGNDHKQIEPNFMYTLLIKEILLTMNYEETAKKQLAKFCQELYRHNPHELHIIQEFEMDYTEDKALRWYTRECFTYKLLNRALRVRDVEVLLEMGFFLRDIHSQIEKLHSQQKHLRQPFTVYRGQGLSLIDLENIQNAKGGFLTFNSFLSTSVRQEVSKSFAERASKRSDRVGVLFEISVDPSKSSTAFCSLDEVSYYKDYEKEILFSMHTVFRIGSTQSLEKKIWLVTLSLCSDNEDNHLNSLARDIRAETKGDSVLHELANVLFKAGDYAKAEEIYESLLPQIDAGTNDSQKSNFYHRLGFIKFRRGNYHGALQFYQKSFEVKRQNLPPNNSGFASIYSEIGSVYEKLGDYSKALEYHQKALDIAAMSLTSTHRNMGIFCNSIGSTYEKMGNYTESLKYYQRALSILDPSLSNIHPDLAATYRGIGSVHKSMKQYDEALKMYEKACKICESSLSKDHPRLALMYGKMAGLFDSMGKYQQALEFGRKALHIQEKTLNTGHPDIAATLNVIGSIQNNLGHYQEALQFYQRALNIREKSLPSNHPDIALTHFGIGVVHAKMGHYLEACPSVERAIDIAQQSLPSQHPSLLLYHKTLDDYKKKL